MKLLQLQETQQRLACLTHGPQPTSRITHYTTMQQVDNSVQAAVQLP